MYKKATKDNKNSETDFKRLPKTKNDSERLLRNTYNALKLTISIIYLLYRCID